MKIFSIVSLLTVLIIGITGCTSDIPQNLDNMPETLAAPDYYTSIEDYENHQHQENQIQAWSSSSNANIYYLPATLPDGFTFSNIQERENVYVAVTYTAQGDTVIAGETTYATERLNSLICQYTISNDPQTTIDQLTQYVGYDQTITHNGKTYHMLTDVDPTSPDTILGYDLAFVENGHVVLLHLPAIDSLENMMQYAAVTMVTLDE